MQSRKRELGGFFLRVVCFVMIAAMVLLGAAYVLTPKHDYGICSMMNYYAQPEDSIDVLCVGTSMFYAGVNTNVLWSEYGIAAYNLCSAEQPFWVSYYTIQEAIKTQHPKVILLDAKPAVYADDYSRHGRTIMSTYAIRGLKNRLGATLACVEDPKEAIAFMLSLPEVHGNYADVTANDFVFPPDNGGRGSDWKGFIEANATEQHQRPSLVWNSVCRNMNSREEEYARRIFELAQEENIPVMLVGMPNPDYAYDHMYYNALWKVAEEYGISGINYNDPELRYGLRYSRHFADWQHLNVEGSVIFSRRLAEDLLSMLELRDHRGDPYYESYDRCAIQWYTKYPELALPGVWGL